MIDISASGCNCNYHIRALRLIRPLLTPDVAKTLAHSTVTSRLDYANALLSGTTSSNLDGLHGDTEFTRQSCMSGIAFHQCHRIIYTTAALPIRQRIAYTSWQSSPPHTINMQYIPDGPDEELSSISHSAISGCYCLCTTDDTGVIGERL